jgi:predicted RNA-binding Zn-ribbon protein involved in translation (DUF1610 family)
VIANQIIDDLENGETVKLSLLQCNECKNVMAVEDIEVEHCPKCGWVGYGELELLYRELNCRLQL